MHVNIVSLFIFIGIINSHYCPLLESNFAGTGSLSWVEFFYFYIQNKKTK